MEDRGAAATARIVGRGRDPRRLAGALLGGSSVVITGSLGSGRSHLIRGVLDELIARGAAPIVIRTGASLAERPFGALDASADRRVASLRDRTTPTNGAPIPVIVDDAHLLDEESARALLAAVYAGRVHALFGVRVPRVRAGRRQDPRGVGAMIIDLWLHNAVDRIDLDELDHAEAERLLDLFPGVERLDAIARATVIALADGSRMLLRELGAVATAAVIAGKDAVDALREIRPHSRVGDAVTAHVDELGDDDRRALAFLGRVPGIEYADAIRFVAPATVDDLLAGGLIAADGTAHRRLTPNWLLAREAARGASAAEALEESEVAAATRMLDAGGEWWSAPIASMIAERWHGGRGPGDGGTPVPAALRSRVALDAARLANDDGRAALAIAYAALAGDDEQRAEALDLERRYAAAVLGPTDQPRRALAEIDPLMLEEELLLRYVRMRAHIVARKDLTTFCGAGMTERAMGQAAAELAVAAAEAAALNMDWVRARDAAARAAAMHEITASTIARAAVVGALSETHLGSWPRARELFERADALCHPPSGQVIVRGTERVLALCIELLAGTLAGAEPPALAERLQVEALAAAQAGTPTAVALVGFCASLAHAITGSAHAAERELAAAIHRSGALPLGPYVPLVELAVAQALVLLGEVGSARAIVARSVLGRHRTNLQFHMRSVAHVLLAAASNDIPEAVSASREAAAASQAAGTPALQLRDLFNLAALGERDPDLLEEIEQLGDRLDLPCAPVLVSRAQGMFRARKSMARLAPIDLLRLTAPWTEDGPYTLVPHRRATDDGGTNTTAPSTLTAVAGGADPTLGLTRREQEIIELVAQGLPNRAIAERLFLSVRTVESHVYQARLKTGASSRADFARMVARRRAPGGDRTAGRDGGA